MTPSRRGLPNGAPSADHPRCFKKHGAELRTLLDRGMSIPELAKCPTLCGEQAILACAERSGESPERVVLRLVEDLIGDCSEADAGRMEACFMLGQYRRPSSSSYGVRQQAIFELASEAGEVSWDAPNPRWWKNYSESVLKRQFLPQVACLLVRRAQREVEHGVKKPHPSRDAAERTT